MAYVDTQDAVMHDFNREDHDDGGNRSRKRSGEAYMEIHQDLPPFLKVTSTWSWATSASSTATPNTP
jgi:hypothetical protein